MFTFDLFKIGGDGKALWIGPVDSIEEGRTVAKLQHVSDPNYDFCVLDQSTGKIVHICREELALPSPRTASQNPIPRSPLDKIPK